MTNAEKARRGIRAILILSFIIGILGVLCGIMLGVDSANTDPFEAAMCTVGLGIWFLFTQILLALQFRKAFAEFIESEDEAPA